MMLSIKPKQAIQKFQNVNNKVKDLVWNIFNIIWLLKLIYGYNSQSDKIKVNALEWPIRSLLVTPSITVSAFLIIFGLISYHSDVLQIEVISIIVIIIFLFLLAIMLLPINYFLRPFNPVVKKFFEKNGEMYTVIEFRWVTKLLLVSIPTMIVSAILITLFNVVFVDVSEKNIAFLKMVLTVITANATIISMAAIFKFGLLLIQTDFRLYLAKFSFEYSIHLDNEYEKIQYVLFGFNTYNKYLRRTIKLQFNDISKIIQYVISDSNKSTNENIKEIHDLINTKEIQLIRTLQKKIATITHDQVLIDISLKDKILEWSPLIAIISSLLISLPQNIPSIIQLISEWLKFIPK